MVNFFYKLKGITYEVICKDTEKFLQEIESLYAEIKKHSIDNISKWIWVDGYIHEETPFYYERNWERRGQEINIEDYPSKYGMYCYGFDKDNIIQAMISPTHDEDKVFENFYVHIDNYEFNICFDYNEQKRIIHFIRKSYNGKNICSLEMYTYSSIKKETFFYKDGRIDSIVEEHFERGGSYRKFDWSIYYDNSNRVLKIVQSDRIEPVYQKIDSIEMIKSSVVNKLVEVIPETLKKKEIGEPVFSIMLVLNSAADKIFPPNITFVTKGQLDEAVKNDTLGSDSYIWDGYEFTENMYYPTNSELSYLSNMINQYVNMTGEYDLYKGILLETCRILMMQDWEGIDEVAEFIIYPCWEEFDAEKNIRDCVSDSKFKLIKKYLYPKPKKSKQAFLKIKSACFEIIESNDGMYLASIGERSVTLWDASSRKEITKFKQIKNPSDVSFSNNGKKLIIKSTTGQYGLFNLSSFELEKEFYTTGEEGGNIFFSPDDKYIIDADWSGNIIFIDLFEDTYDIIKEYKNYMITQINKINFSLFQFVFKPKCSRETGCIEDNVVLLEWQYPFRESSMAEKMINYKSINFFKYSPNGTYCAVISNSEILIHSADLKNIIHKIDLDYPKHISWSIDEKYIAVVHSNYIKIIQISDFSIIKDICMEYACRADFTAGGEYITLCSWEKGYYIKIRDLLDDSTKL